MPHHFREDARYCVCVCVCVCACVRVVLRTCPILALEVRWVNPGVALVAVAMALAILILVKVAPAPVAASSDGDIGFVPPLLPRPRRCFAMCKSLLAEHGTAVLDKKIKDLV